ncbi:hypothetical protein EDD85DRAFT_787871 [Armillaria nabsnona]|nr:hypothetical protein EDD85DRAFT_787871 [Armillaria nabsnona]
MVALNAGAGLVLAFWHAREPNLHCGVFTFSWKWLASTLVFDWFLAGCFRSVVLHAFKSATYDIQQRLLLNVPALVLVTFSSTAYAIDGFRPSAHSQLHKPAVIEPKVLYFIAKPKTKYYETISCVLSRRLESVIWVPDLAGVRVRESGAAVEGDDGKSRRNSSLPLVMEWLSLLKRELPTSTASNLVSYMWAAQNLEEWRVVVACRIDGAWWVFAGFAESDSAR